MLGDVQQPFQTGYRASDYACDLVRFPLMQSSLAFQEYSQCGLNLSFQFIADRLVTQLGSRSHRDNGAYRPKCLGAPVATINMRQVSESPVRAWPKVRVEAS
jgi:hypothetical protein